MAIIYAATNEDIDAFIERLLAKRNASMLEVVGEFTFGDHICKLTCRPRSTKNSLLDDFYSWKRNIMPGK